MQWKTARDFTDTNTMLTVRVSRLDRWNMLPEFSYSIGLLNQVDDTMRRFIPFISTESFGRNDQCESFLSLFKEAADWVISELEEERMRKERELEKKRIRQPTKKD